MEGGTTGPHSSIAALGLRCPEDVLRLIANARQFDAHKPNDTSELFV